MARLCFSYFHHVVKWNNHQSVFEFKPLSQRQNKNTHHVISLLLACNKKLTLAIYLEERVGS